MSLEVGFRVGPGQGRPRFSCCHVRQSGGLVIAAGQPGVHCVMHLSRRIPTRRIAPPTSLSPATGSRCALLAFQPERTPADELQFLPFEPFAKLARYRVLGIEGVGALAGWKESRPLLSDGVSQTIPLGNGERTYSSEQRYHSIRRHSSTGCSRGWPRNWVRWASAVRRLSGRARRSAIEARPEPAPTSRISTGPAASRRNSGVGISTGGSIA